MTPEKCQLDREFECKVREMEHQYVRLRSARENRSLIEWTIKDAEKRIDHLRREIFAINRGEFLDEAEEADVVFDEFGEPEWRHS